MKWLKYSGFWCGFVLNPYHWNGEILKMDVNTKEYAFNIELNLGPIWVRLTIDDGRY